MQSRFVMGSFKKKENKIKCVAYVRRLAAEDPIAEVDVLLPYSTKVKCVIINPSEILAQLK